MLGVHRATGVPGRASLQSRPKGDWAEELPTNSRGDPATAVATQKPNWAEGPLRRTSSGEDRRRSLGQRKQPRTDASARLETRVELGEVEGLEGQTGSLGRPRGEPPEGPNGSAGSSLANPSGDPQASQQKESVLQQPTRGKWNPGGSRSKSQMKW